MKGIKVDFALIKPQKNLLSSVTKPPFLNLFLENVSRDLMANMLKEIDRLRKVVSGTADGRKINFEVNCIEKGLNADFNIKALLPNLSNKRLVYIAKLIKQHKDKTFKGSITAEIAWFYTEFFFEISLYSHLMNSLLKGINKENKEFLASEGSSLSREQMVALKARMRRDKETRLDDLLAEVRNLFKKHQ